MNINRISILLPMLFIVLTTLAQDENDKPDIKPIIKVFGNYHFGLNEYSGSNAFEIKRAYLGFATTLSNNFSFKTNIDVGNPKNGSTYEYTAYLKTAALNYKNGKLSVDFGLIGLKNFKLQEKTWGHRYIFKSFQDEHSFSHSADFGVSIDYKIVDNFSIDATIRNGEGYKKLQSDETYRGAFGLTYNITDDLFIRGVYDVTSKSVTQTLISGFIAYKFKDVLLTGIEYNSLQNNDFVNNENLTGFSIYSSYELSEKIEFFGRFDQLSSNKFSGVTTQWNLADDGQAIIGGIQFKLDKKVKIATNMQYWAPADNTINKEVYMYINFEYKF